MSKKGNSGDVLRCSFCNKSQRDVKKLIGQAKGLPAFGCLRLALLRHVDCIVAG